MPINKKTLNKGVKGKTVNKKVNKVKSKGGMLSGDKGKTGASNISSIADDLRIEILQSLFKHSKILDSKMIMEYINIISHIPVINKSFRDSVSSITPKLNNVTIINLQNIEVSDAVLRVLNMTNPKKIDTIEIRNITFKSKVIYNKFLEFLRENMNARNVKLEKIDGGINRLIEILETYNRIEHIEISSFELTYDEYHEFMKILLYKRGLKYLTLKRNDIDKIYETYMLTKDVDNVNYIDNERYIIYISKENNNRWGMIIRRGDGRLVKNIEVNIVNNYIIGSILAAKNYKNDFVVEK
jgi:hypothetical protein